MVMWVRLQPLPGNICLPSPSGGNNGSPFGSNMNVNFGENQSNSPTLSPRGPFLGETSPLYEEDYDQFDLEMDMERKETTMEAVF